ncbi:MAG: hypothetical protein ACXVZU_05455 [Methanobacteriaceae archaeon]
MVINGQNPRVGSAFHIEALWEREQLGKISSGLSSWGNPFV